MTMTIKEMSNEYLMRFYIATKRELKTTQSTLKQIEEELDKRFDAQKLIEKESE